MNWYPSGIFGEALIVITFSFDVFKFIKKVLTFSIKFWMPLWKITNGGITPTDSKLNINLVGSPYSLS